MLGPARLHITGHNTPVICHGAQLATTLGIPEGCEIKNAAPSAALQRHWRPQAAYHEWITNDLVKCITWAIKGDDVG